MFMIIKKSVKNTTIGMKYNKINRDLRLMIYDFVIFLAVTTMSIKS